MIRKTKTALSLLLALVLIFTSAAAVFAYEYDENAETYNENGYAYQLRETPDGIAFSFLEFWGDQDTAEAYVPKTIAGVTLTPENFNGEVFCYAYGYIPLRTDEDNAYFTVSDGSLYTKNGKTLVYSPCCGDENLCFTVPDGVETIGPDALWGTACLVIPGSVTSIIEGKNPLYCDIIAGFPGTVAETYAAGHNIPFVEMGENHTHTYFRRLITPATCQNGGVAELFCPCGETKTFETQQTDHFFFWVWDGDSQSCSIVCGYCGRTWEEIYGEPYDDGGDYPSVINESSCECVCHKLIERIPGEFSFSTVINVVRDFFYRLKIVIWRMTGTHQYCECGARHY